MSAIPDTSNQYNTRILPPKLANGDQEMIIQSIKSGTMQSTNNFCNRRCEVDGSLKNKSLTKSQSRGRSKLLKRVKDQEVIISMTDKSGKIAIWNTPLYIVVAQEHTAKDNSVDKDFVNKVETNANALANSM